MATADGGEPRFDPPPVAPATGDELFAKRLAAVRLLLDTERDVATHDILLASAFEFLSAGPKTTDEVLSRITTEWPGVAVTRTTVRRSLQAAEKHGFVAIDPHAVSSERWRLLEAGQRHVSASRDWGRDVIDRTNAYLADEARQALSCNVTGERARAWGGVLRDALFAGIARAFTEDPRAMKVVDSLLFPASYDLDFIRGRIEENCDDDEVREFLSVMAAAALAPSNPFGSELVHHIAIGYVLYAYVGRHDRQDARSEVGSLSGEVALLDTPMLVRMLGAHDDKAPVFDIIGQATRTGIRVVLTEDSVEELNRLLAQREDSGVVADVEEALRREGPEVILRRSDDVIVVMWMEFSAQSGRPPLWPEFRQAASRLPDTLRALGVEMLPSESCEPSDSALSAAFKKALEDRLSGPFVRGRGEFNVQHDTRLLAEAHRCRQENPPSDSKMWPGSFIVTPDKQLDAAYRTVVGDTPFPVALTPAQWAGVVATCADPVSVERLAGAIARETSHETLLARSASLPLDTALEIARSLAGTGASVTDAEHVQLTFEQVVAERPDLLNASGDDATRLAGEVLSRRHRSFEQATREHRERQKAETDRAAKEREVADRSAARLVASAEEGKRKERSLRVDTQDLLNDERETTKRLRRVIRSGAGGLVVLVAVLVAALTDTVDGWWEAAAWFALLAYVGAAVDYCVNLDRRLVAVVASALVGTAVLGVGTAVQMAVSDSSAGEPGAVSEAEARVAFDRLVDVAAGRTVDAMNLVCGMSADGCSGLSGAVRTAPEGPESAPGPESPPTVLCSHDAGDGARLLVVEGEDGWGRPYVSQMVFARDGDGVQVVREPAFWLGVYHHGAFTGSTGWMTMHHPQPDVATGGDIDDLLTLARTPCMAR